MIVPYPLQKRYRSCVGIALFNSEGKVFVGERLDTPGAWQMPQGGMDSREFLEQAAFRELREETGVTSAEILEIAKENIFYDLPEEMRKRLWGGKYQGQEQTWIAMRFTGEEGEIDLNTHSPAEFSNWQWVDLEKTVDLIVPFKRETYEKVIALFSHLAG